jgi:hypothetical protein
MIVDDVIFNIDVLHDMLKYIFKIDVNKLVIKA